MRREKTKWRELDGKISAKETALEFQFGSLISITHLRSSAFIRVHQRQK
jgi:hypothetical protein